MPLGTAPGRCLREPQALGRRDGGSPLRSLPCPSSEVPTPPRRRRVFEAQRRRLQPARVPSRRGCEQLHAEDMNANVRLSDYKGAALTGRRGAAPQGRDPRRSRSTAGSSRASRFGVLSQDEPSTTICAGFASGFKMNYPVFRASEDFENAHGPIWAPTTYIIDRTERSAASTGAGVRDTVERETIGPLVVTLQRC